MRVHVEGQTMNWICSMEIMVWSSYKARLVAQGCSQRPRINYDKTFAPVVRFEAIRSVIALANYKNMKIHQMNIITAFLNGELMKDVFTCQPGQFKQQGKEEFVCHLTRASMDWNNPVIAGMKLFTAI